MSIRGEQEPRTESLWSNLCSDARNRKPLPITLNRTLRSFDEAAALSFPDLDRTIDHKLEKVAKDWNALVPYLLEMNRRLSAPGRRSDLRRGAPADLTWTAWVQSKRAKLGRSLRSVQRLLSGKSEASKSRQSQPCARGARGSVDAPEMPATPMETAAEMAWLVLAMRDRNVKSGLGWRRLKLLAEHFLTIAGQASVRQEELNCLAGA